MGSCDHGIAPPNLTVSAGWLPIAAAVGGGVMAALLAVLAAARRAARVPPTHALTDAAVEPRLIGPGRMIGGLLALAGAAPLFAVSTTTGAPDTAAATSEMTALFLVAAVGFLGPLVARVAAGVLGPPLARLSPVGGFLASTNLRTATRRFSSASTPLMLTVGLSCTLLFSSTTIDHAVTQQRHAGVTGELAITSTGPGLPAAALADVRAVPGVRSAVALTPTTLGPSLGVSDDTVPAQILSGGQGGGLDVGVTAGSLRRCTATRSPSGAGAPTARTPGSATACPSCSATGPAARAKVVAIYTRALGFGDALLAPELAAGHQTSPLLATILVRTGEPAAVARRLRALAPRYPGLRVSDRASLATVTDADRETNRWLGPLFVAIIFAFTSIAVVNTLTMIALQRGRELGLLRLVGGTPRQVRSMARWEAGLIVTIGLGLGLAIAATALLPLSHALTGSIRPHVPPDQLAAILGVSAVLALLALALPTRRALRARPVEAIGVGNSRLEGPRRAVSVMTTVRTRASGRSPTPTSADRFRLPPGRAETGTGTLPSRGAERGVRGGRAARSLAPADCCASLPPRASSLARPAASTVRRMWVTSSGLAEPGGRDASSVRRGSVRASPFDGSRDLDA